MTNEPFLPPSGPTTPAGESEILAAAEAALERDPRSGDCISALLSVLRHSGTDEHRAHALRILLRATGRRNTRLALPRDIEAALSSSERHTLEQFREHLKKASARSGITKFPHYQFEFTDLIAFAETYFGPEREPFLTPTSRIVTLGSCFAQNIAIHLQARAFDVWTLFLGEGVNNSYNALWILENLRALQSPSHPFWAKVPEDIFQACHPLEQRLASADCIVYSLGLSLAMTSPTGDVIAEPLLNAAHFKHQGHHLTEIPLEQNIQNMTRIIDLLHEQNPQATIVLTLSPVPLDAVVHCSQSVVSADCISKSLGRVTLNEVKKRRPECVYFPSFELVRWAACNQSMPLFGGDAEEHSTAHVTRSVVAQITEVFERFYVASDTP